MGGAQAGEGRWAEKDFLGKVTKEKAGVAHKDICEAQHTGRFQLNTGNCFLF